MVKTIDLRIMHDIDTSNEGTSRFDRKGRSRAIEVIEAKSAGISSSAGVRLT